MVTHALTRVHLRPVIEVVEVKEIDRTPDILTFTDDFIISDRDRQMLFPEMIIDRELRRSKDRIIHKLHESCFTISSHVNHMNQERYSVQIKILPIKK